MCFPDSMTLAARICAGGLHGESDTIDEGAGQRGILAMARTCGISRYRGRTLLLALPTQLATIAAMIQLDGVAKRIVLWPRDGAPGQLEEVARRAGVDEIVTHGPESAARSGDGASDETTEWVLLTSGTTGQPKLVAHTLQTLAGHIQPRPGPGPVWATFYDIRRYGGLQIVLRALIGGGSLLLPSAGEAMGDFLVRAGAAAVSHVLGTPSHWRLALMAHAPSLIAPRYVRLSGEVADQGILDLLTGAFPDAALVHAFASTEAGLAFEITDRRAGFPAALLDRNDIAAVQVQDATLRIRSARCALGTLNDGVEALPTEDGFVDTGDAVELRDGRYFFAGRQDGMVNVGGQKVYPEEVEAVLNQHPAVQMSLVTARRSPITGAVVSAAVVARPDIPAEGLTAALREYCRSRLPRHKVPVSIRLVPRLAMAASGKLVRPRA